MLTKHLNYLRKVRSYRNLAVYLLFAAVCISFLSCQKEIYFTGPQKILVFTKTTAYEHASTVNGKAAIEQLGTVNGFEVESTADASWFTEKKLSEYNAVVFLNTNGYIFDSSQKAAFENFIRKGGGYVGIHSAADTEKDWVWYKKLVGATFAGFSMVEEAELHVEDKSHASTKHLPAVWKRTDEWNEFKDVNENCHILLTVDENTYSGGTMGSYHPIAWYHDYDGGRSFYTALGHTPESYTEPDFLLHILGGIQYAINK